MTGHILDGIVIVLLILAIIYGIRLNRRIHLIRESKEELAQLFYSFDQTILKAEESVRTLKEMSTVSGDKLQQKLDAAMLKIDDLNFLQERADKAAIRLENLLERSRGDINVPSAHAPSLEEPAKPTPEQIRQMRQSSAKATPQNDNQHGNESGEKVKAIEAMLHKIAMHKKDNSAGATPPASKAKKAPPPPPKTKEASIASTLRSMGFGHKG